MRASAALSFCDSYVSRRGGITGRSTLRPPILRWLVGLAAIVALHVASGPTALGAGPTPLQGSDAGADIAATAEESPPDVVALDAGDLADGDLGAELLLFEDIPVVFSASRRAVPMTLTSVPTSVITADDIHYSGLTTIGELLLNVPGVDVLQIDRNRWAVGVRGLHAFTSDRTLTLIDGRNADSPVYGGGEFYRLPIFVEDIERIEVVRGPGGAAWGANAFNGVINLIMKQPKDVLGVMGTTTWNDFGDSYSQFRWAEQDGTWSWRVSAGYEDVESSDNAIHEDEFTSQDYGRTTRIDTAFVNEIDDRTKLSFGVGYSYVEQGPFEFSALFLPEDGELHTIRSYARLDREFESGASGYLQWYLNYSYTDQAAFTRYRSTESDVEAQYNFDIDGGHHISLGGNVRVIHVDAKETNPQDVIFIGNPYNEQWLGFFIMDRWDMTDRFTLEGQFRGDWYSETQVDWSGRVTGLLAMDEQKNHVLRISAAKAFRSPLSALRETSVSRVPLPIPPPPQFYGLNVTASDMHNEQIYTVEGGYVGNWPEGWTFRTDAYWQRYNSLIAGVDQPDPLFPVPLPTPRSIIVLDNKTHAYAYGSETEIAFQEDNIRVSAWYTYNAFHGEEDPGSVRAYQPAQHKVGLHGRVFLPEGWAVNAQYRYTSQTPNAGGATSTLPDHHRVDLTVTKDLFDGRGELQFGISDMLDDTEFPVTDVGSFTSHDTPGRTFFMRAQVNF